MTLSACPLCSLRPSFLRFSLGQPTHHTHWQLVFCFSALSFACSSLSAQIVYSAKGDDTINLLELHYNALQMRHYLLKKEWDGWLKVITLIVSIVTIFSRFTYGCLMMISLTKVLLTWEWSDWKLSWQVAVIRRSRTLLAWMERERHLLTVMLKLSFWCWIL